MGYIWELIKQPVGHLIPGVCWEMTQLASEAHDGKTHPGAGPVPLREEQLADLCTSDAWAIRPIKADTDGERSACSNGVEPLGLINIVIVVIILFILINNIVMMSLSWIHHPPHCDKKDDDDDDDDKYKRNTIGTKQRTDYQ